MSNEQSRMSSTRMEAHMERSARRLLLASLLAFPVVVALGSALGPAHRRLSAFPDALRALDLFHTHFDQLVWLGSSALGAALHLLAPRYSGPVWAPRWLAPAYLLGALLFSVSFAVKGVALRLGMVALARWTSPLLASLGGVSLLVAAVCAATVASLRQQARSRAEQTAPLSK